MQTLLRDSVRFFSRNLTPIALIILPFSIALELLDAGIWASYSAEITSYAVLFAPMAAELLIAPVYTAALVFFVASSVTGKPLDIRACWRLGFRYWPPFLLLYLIVGLGAAIGFALLIVPGLIVLARLAFAEFELLLQGLSVNEALNASWHSTKPFMWTILGGYAVLFLGLYGPYYIVSEAFDIESALLASVINVLYSVLGALFTIFTFRVYYETKRA